MMSTLSSHTKRTGFTIVELLIVIVVIGILATITIVAYNGISNRAKVASAQNDLSSAAKSLEQYRVTISTTDKYPATQADANVKVSNGAVATYTYRAIDNSYCLTLVNGAVSYFADSSTKAPKVGNCTNDSIVGGLVGWWTFDGNANDQSGNALNGTVSGATLTSGADASTNGAYAFNGTNQFVGFGNSTKFNSPEITLSAWTRTATPTVMQNIIAKEVQYKYRFVSGGVGVLIGGTGAGWTDNFIAPYTFAANTWYHIVLTISTAKNTAAVYVNGALVSSVTLTVPVTAYNTTSVFAGIHNSTVDPLNGAMDDARIYSYALTAAEVAGLYTAGAQ